MCIGKVKVRVAVVAGERRVRGRERATEVMSTQDHFTKCWTAVWFVWRDPAQRRVRHQRTARVSLERSSAILPRSRRSARKRERRQRPAGTPTACQPRHPESQLLETVNFNSDKATDVANTQSFD